MDELLYGSPAHRPITSAEISEWFALWKLRQHERQEQERRARR